MPRPKKSVARCVSWKRLSGKRPSSSSNTYQKLMLDHLRHRPPFTNSEEHITWGLSRTWASVGETLPAEVTVMCLGNELALVFLPGEVFVELGMAIKQASPFRTTLVVELSNCVETIYIPHRAAYAGGSYEVTNSALQPGSGRCWSK